MVLQFGGRRSEAGGSRTLKTMCGICGMVEFGGMISDGVVVEEMVSQLRHRGPDGEGVFVRDQCALGHTRLAIIDPDGGRQPLFNEEGSIGVTFNGEIYNFRELRRELESAGYVFRTLSDTEVIVHAWEEWGENCVHRFRGMFAFAIADWGKRQLFLARDQLGIKPLYFSESPTGLRFASEPNVLTLAPDFNKTLDLVALDQYLQLGYIPAPRSAFLSIRKLAPGTAMLVGFDGTFRRTWRFWELCFHPDHSLGEEDWVTQLDAAIRESVESHLVSDVPFGAFLSGGMDSTLVVGYMSEILKEPVRTFSIGFSASDFDESRYAQLAALKFSTVHSARTIEADVIKVLHTLTGLYGEPFGDASAVPTYYLSELARDSVAMVLSGDGGDEGMGGYRRYDGWASGRHRLSASSFVRMWLGALRRGRLRIYEKEQTRPLGSRLVSDWMYYVGLFGFRERQGLWHEQYRSVVGHPIELFEDAIHRRGGTTERSMGQFLDYQTYLPEDILRKVDVASMAHGLEVRTPLVDRRIVDVFTRVPVKYTAAYREDGTWRSKPLFRALLARHFDDEFVNRPKQGFMLPLRHWLSSGGPLRGWAEDLIGRDDSSIAALLRRDAVRSLFVAHDSGQDCSQRIWALLVLETWLRQVTPDFRGSTG